MGWTVYCHTIPPEEEPQSQGQSAVSFLQSSVWVETTGGTELGLGVFLDHWGRRIAARLVPYDDIQSPGPGMVDINDGRVAFRMDVGLRDVELTGVAEEMRPMPYRRTALEVLANEAGEFDHIIDAVVREGGFDRVLGAGNRGGRLQEAALVLVVDPLGKENTLLALLQPVSR